MSNKPQLILWGAGGHAKVVLEAIDPTNRESLCCIVDIEGGEKTLCGVAVRYVASPDEWFERCESPVFVAIGDNKVRKRCLTQVEEKGLQIPTIISNTAYISPSASIGRGSFVGPNAIINTVVSSGKGCIFNSGAIIEHDCHIGNYTHVSSGAVLGGNVCVGNGALIGLGARVLPGVRIGDHAIIGAGSVVTNDVSEHQIYCGIPAKPIN